MHAPGSTSDERIEALRRKADLLHRDRRFAEEADAWSEICQIEPDNALWLHNLALALLHCDRLAECLPLFGRLLHEAPTLSRVHNNFAMAALRLGVPPTFVAPHFIQALELSEDNDEFYRHLLNSCNSIVYGFDDRAESEAALDILGDRVVRLIEERSEPKYRHTNRDYMTRLIDVYRHLIRFRTHFARTEWSAAKEALDLAIHELRQMELHNFVRGLDSIQATFELARGITAYIENIADGLYTEPGDALAVCVTLRKQCKPYANQPDKYHMLHRLYVMLVAFVDAMDITLTYLSSQDLSRYDVQQKCTIIRDLSVDYFSNLGQDFLTALRMVNKVCAGIAITVSQRASPRLSYDERHAAWRKICLLFNGLHLDFRAVDVALARGYLGWTYDARQECSRVVHGFKTFIERQAWRDLYVNGVPQENIGRALLQTYLLPRNYREIPVKGGQSDILMFERDVRIVFETKIWRGRAYFDAGLREINEYIEGEGDDGRLACTFYIIFDSTKTQRGSAYVARRGLSARMKNKNIEVVVLNIKPAPPSAKEAQRY